MKIIAVFLLSTISTFAFGQTRQGSLLQIVLLNKNLEHVPFYNFKLNDINSKTQILGKTDKFGKADLVIKGETSYTFNCNDLDEEIQIDLPDKEGFKKRTIILNKENILSNFPDTIYQKSGLGSTPKGLVLVKKTWIDKRKRKLPNLQVALYNQKTNKVYVTKTNSQGNSTFRVPEGVYLMSAGKLTNYTKVEAKITDEIVFAQFASYIPTTIKEKIANDTITQEIPPTQEGTSESGLYILKLIDYNNKPLSNETVCINKEYTSEVYTAQTDNYGIAKFLLPKGQPYTVHLKYSRSIDHVWFENINKSFSKTTTVSYKGSKAIEKFHEEQKLIGDGFRSEFDSRIIQKSAEPLQYFKKKPYGFHLDFKTTSPCSSPMVKNGKIFVSGGYNSKKFYCFNAKTGRFIWGVELAEGGASPAVLQDNVLLVNTESCTLYAIDITSGKLLWSKWLSGYVYSTPTSAKGMVLTAYPKKISRAYNKNNWALVAFDLKTGETKWQQSIDNDIFVAPVVAEDNVFLTTLSGTVYKISLKNGQNVVSNKLLSTNLPTIVNSEVCLSVKDKDANNKYLCIADTAKLEKQRTLKTVPGKYIAPKGLFERMNYLGGQIVHKNGKNYQLLDDKIVCSDHKTTKILWKKALPYLATSYMSAPVVLKKAMLIATPNGKVYSLNPSTGKILKTFKVNTSIATGPVVENGWIYFTTHDGQMVAINTKDAYTYTGWPQWGLDGGHNLFLE